MLFSRWFKKAVNDVPAVYTGCDDTCRKVTVDEDLSYLWNRIYGIEKYLKIERGYRPVEKDDKDAR